MRVFIYARSLLWIEESYLKPIPYILHFPISQFPHFHRQAVSPRITPQLIGTSVDLLAQQTAIVMEAFDGNLLHLMHRTAQEEIKNREREEMKIVSCPIGKDGSNPHEAAAKGNIIDADHSTKEIKFILNERHLLRLFHIVDQMDAYQFVHGDLSLSQFLWRRHDDTLMINDFG
jgi:hypothetical protein